jgi:hypothetical protein
MSAVIVLVLRVLFSISLFAFLGWIIYVLWKDLQQTVKSDLEYEVPLISLLLIENGQEFKFDLPEFFIGRDPQASLHIPDDTLSAIHTRVYFKSGHWMIEDLQSTNGTFINGERLSTPSVLINGDEVTCGQVRFQVDLK